MRHEKRRYVVDEHGRKESVVLSFKEYQELLEDLRDLAVIAERKEEPAEPFETLRDRLEEKWQSTGSR